VTGPERSGREEVPAGALEAALAPLDRRAFLRLAGAAAALGLLPAGCGAQVPAGLVPPEGLRLHVLSPRGYATFQAFAIRLVGARGAEAIATRRLDPAAAADAWVARLPDLSGPLTQGLWLLEWGVWPFLAKLGPFTSAGPEVQDRVIEDLMRSRMDTKRDLYKGLKSLAMLAFYAQPASRPLVGDPRPFDLAGIARAMAGPVED
jgi:hypothetical protein